MNLCQCRAAEAGAKGLKGKSPDLARNSVTN